MRRWVVTILRNGVDFAEIKVNASDSRWALTMAKRTYPDMPNRTYRVEEAK